MFHTSRMNPLNATEYVNDIYSYYKRVEHKFHVPHDYMKVQVSHGCVKYVWVWMCKCE